MIKITQKEFINCFNRNVYKKIVKETSIPYDTNVSYSQFKDILKEVYEELKNGNYSNSAPRNFLQLHKSLYVARNIPLLSIKDEALYYFITKYIEDDIAHNRTQYTFGGWKLGNPLKQKESDDIDEIQYVYGSYNPTLWSSAWKQFNKISASFSLSEDYEYAIKLDISNFYDSINFNILYSKLLECISKEKIWILDYLLFFLKHWNKKVDNYRERSSGLPQTEFGDQSRILANFYLQDYDSKMKIVCDKYDAVYVRYADDQIIFLKDENRQEIMYTANIELNNIGLNLNVAKTKLYDINELNKHYLFQQQIQLDNKEYNKSFKSFYKLYETDRNSIRYDIYIHRIFSKKIGLGKLSKQNQVLAKHIVFDKEFLISSNLRTLNNIYDNLTANEKVSFIELLLSFINEVSFNSYLYVLLQFFNSQELHEKADLILNLINDKYNSEE